MKFLASLLFIIMAIAFFDGCAAIPYKPKQLESSKARGITFTNDIPSNCKVLGVVEGKDSQRIYAAVASLEALREGALNDLRNEASYVVEDNKHIMLYITKEQMSCPRRKNGVCKGSNDWTGIDSYRVHAQVLDCGNR